MTLVSCIYNYGPSSIIGGRGWDLSFYISSLINISKLEIPLVIYTSPKLVESTYNTLSKYFSKGLKVEGYELENFRHFEKFISWKEKTIDKKNFYNNRNEILCYSKPFWLKSVAKNNYFNSESFAWIDSGLTHHGIFPEAKGGVELMTKPVETHYYPHNPKNIFTPELGKKIREKINQDKMFFCSTIWHGEKTMFKNFLLKNYNIDLLNVEFNKHLVGGLFGSKKETVYNFCDIFDNYLDNIIEEHLYCLEEQIISMMNVAIPHLFDCEFFSTWYYFSKGERCSYLQEEGDSFYKIFERI